MEPSADHPIAIVGLGAVLPDAPNVAAFWENVQSGRYSISEVTPDRWNPALYYDPDPAAPDKTYSKIGGWVRDFAWDPVKWRLPIPPRVAEAMDGSQQWAIACTREALTDYGYPERRFDLDRTAVILGNAMGGEKHYFTVLRVYFPEFQHELDQAPSFAALPAAMRGDITRELHARMGKRLPEVTEDSMPGELANCIAGRVANLYNFHGPNYIVDAACASAMAAVSAAAQGLTEQQYDLAITGGIDRNMGASTFVKFCKIGALSATGSRPYAEGADGFVMGEGAVIFLLKRLADAERDGDKIYAVLRGIAGSSDGKGKGITAPNPVGQRLCMERAWQNAGLSPATATYIEGHGTSTRVGDVVEVQSMSDVLKDFQLPANSIALGSVKSNIGHLKAGAASAGLLKAVLALRNKVLPPSVRCERRNPEIDFEHSPFYVNTEAKPWTVPADGVRRAGVSAFGFGGTNFHTVLEEYIPHKLTGNGKRLVAVPDIVPTATRELQADSGEGSPSRAAALKPPFRGALILGADCEGALMGRLRAVHEAAQAGRAPAPMPPSLADLRASQRLAIDYADAAELAGKCASALQAFAIKQPAVWKALRAQGIFRGQGPAPKVAFLYPGQGSQYVNMLRPLRAAEPIVADTFAEADRVMTPLLGKPLTDFIFVDQADPAVVAKAEEDLRQTAITQPAVLAADLAMTRLLAAYGIQPDFAMGHSLGEYGALVAAGALPFADALEAVSARGREMTRVSLQDNGLMAAVFAPLEDIERLLKSVDGYVVIANINSGHQAVIGGASKAMEQAVDIFLKAGFEVTPLPVSHAFHTSIVAPASEPLRQTLQRLHLESPRVPVVANVDGQFYPTGPNAVSKMLDILAKQVASPVQFIQGLRTLYDAGARIFVEVGPKKALQGFAEDVLGKNPDVLSLFTNHPKFGDMVSFNQALCGLYAAGLGGGTEITAEVKPDSLAACAAAAAPPPVSVTQIPSAAATAPASGPSEEKYDELGRLLAGILDRGWQIYRGQGPIPADQPVVITGAALGLPGTERIFDDANVARILHGDQFIDVVPQRFRQAMLDKHITRLVKSESGEPVFETIHDLGGVIKLAGRGGAFDLEREFGVSAERLAALDRTTCLAIAAGIDALRDAGIPLVMRYKTTSKGGQLPERWALPDALRDDTGVVFASAFPGSNSFAEIMSGYYADHARGEQMAMLESLRARLAQADGRSILGAEIERRMEELREAMEKAPFVFDRRFLFRVLAMGHSQFAEFIGARGPNTQINAACASTAQGVSLAEDWIRAGRCRRVVLLSADDITSDHLMEWFGAGFLASGAAATDDVVEDAAIPFDRRRHGMIVGMGAAALVIESAEAARERGIQPICQVLSAAAANSAFHGTRLDVDHIGQVMEALVAQAERRFGIRRSEIAPQTVFVSHETYTPARGGSASAEICSLRRVFGKAADQIVIANTKGFTGHAMATGIEEVVAVKALETGCVPPVPNFKEVDPELGALNLSKGGLYPVEYALRLGAGFGSQIGMALLRRVPTRDGVRPSPNALGYEYRIVDRGAWKEWLSRMAGGGAAELEVVQRTLRVRDRGRRAAQSEARIESLLKADLRTDVSSAGSTVAAAPVPVAPLPRAAAAPEPTQAVKKPVAAVAAAVVRDSIKLAIAPGPAQKQDAESVKERILALVVEKTGYPRDMLDLDLDLEADLGIDTVKQAEMFAAIRAAYNIPRDENLKLRDFPTLAHVIKFALDRQAGAASTPAAIPVPAALAAELGPKAAVAVQPASDDSIKNKVLEIVAEKTGYPKDMLDLDLDLEADLGIDTVKQAEMFAAIRAAYNIPREENLKLRDFPTLAHVIKFAQDRHAGPESAPVPAPVAASPKPEPSQSAAAAAQPIALDSIQEKVLEIVAEKTGYPKDMLDLDLDLEADLGIDTVKQAEMFAAIRAAYKIPRDENLKLRDFPTLAHVIRFAQERQGPVAAPVSAPVARIATPPAELKSSASAPGGARPAAASLEPANRIPRRVPVPTLRPPLGLCKRTGVELQAGSRVIIMPDQGGAGRALEKELQKRGVEVLWIEGAPDAETLAARLKDWASTGLIQGVYWIPALDNEGPISAMDLEAWHRALHIRLKLLYAATRALYEQIAKAGTFLVCATRLGGQHGYDDAGAVAPLGGAVTGFSKAYKRERPDAVVKAVDFSAEGEASEIADLLIQETLQDPGAIEVGYKAGQRWTVGLQEQPASDGQPGLALNKETVFVVTGAAGSIVSAITSDLAAASGGTFYLLDLVPAPDPQNPDLKRFANDKEGLKRDLFARIQARGERATPALVEKELAALERAQAAQNAIDAVQAAGGVSHYFSANLTDAASVGEVIRQIRERSGRIDVLLHAAGMERSHFLPDKDPREFDLVFDVKSDGWFNLLHAIGEMPLGATMAFSSVAGRFGNAGQADYSASNDLLCKMTSNLRTTRPATRGMVIDWTAWAGIGMAARGSIPKMMEVAGIDMLPAEAGIPTIRRELTAGGARGEIVVGQRLGVLLNEWDASGGLDSEAAGGWLQQHATACGPMVGKITAAQIADGLTIETTLDPSAQPFLHDHQIEGTPVLPGVMGMEAFAEAACCMLPEWQVEAIEDVNFLAPFKFYRNQPRNVITRSAVRQKGNSVLADCQLIGCRTLVNQAEPQLTTHFTGRVRLSREAPAAPAAAEPRPAGARVDASIIYRAYFHGPAYRVIEHAWWDGRSMVGQMAKGLPANHHPAGLPLLAAPRLIELCFQTAGLWEMGLHGRLGLPWHIDEVRIWRRPEQDCGLFFAVVTPRTEGSFDAEVLDAAGVRYLHVRGYRTAEFPGAVDAEALRAINAAISARAMVA